MAKNYWIGDAAAVAQVWTGVIDTVDGTPANNVFTVTIGGVAVSATGVTDVATTATALRAALNASTHPYFAAITWSGTAGNIIGTADTAGVPFLSALTVSGIGSGSVTDFAVTTANAGPHCWTTAANWSLYAAPVDTNEIILKDSADDILWNLDNSTITPASFIMEKSFTGKIGLPKNVFTTSEDGATTATTAVEYRQSYLKFATDATSACKFTYGANPSAGTPAGSGRVNIDSGTLAAIHEILSTAAASADAGYPAINILSNYSTCAVLVRSAPGGVGIAGRIPGETASLDYVRIFGSDARVYVGDGVTFKTGVTQDNGVSIIRAAATIPAVTVDGGTLTTEGDYTVTAFAVRSGTVYPNHVKTGGNAITALTQSGGTVDGTQSPASRTWATVTLKKGATLKVDPAAVTITTPALDTVKTTIAVS